MRTEGWTKEQGNDPKDNFSFKTFKNGDMQKYSVSKVLKCRVKNRELLEIM